MRTITAMFDDREDAEEASRELSALGIMANDVTIHDQQSVTGGASLTTPGQSQGGLWDSFKSLFTDDHDTYAEGIRRGGYLLTARVDDSLADQAIDILDDEGTVDLDERSSAWRNDGWTGGAATTGASAYDTNTTGEQSIPIVEEQLQVGKREVSRGGVRVRSYIVETPVHEEVSLREEHVDVQRRPYSGNDNDAAALLQERTIEVSETAEEAIIGKTAHVREEVVVGKTVENRVEQIDDSVRRTEVDIERTGGETRTGGEARTGYDAGTTTDRGTGSVGDKVAGLANEAVGNTKQGIGSVTGSENLRDDGLAQERRGESQQGRDRSGY